MSYESVLNHVTDNVAGIIRKTAAKQARKKNDLVYFVPDFGNECYIAIDGAALYKLRISDLMDRGIDAEYLQAVCGAPMKALEDLFRKLCDKDRHLTQEPKAVTAPEGRYKAVYLFEIDPNRFNGYYKQYPTVVRRSVMNPAMGSGANYYAGNPTLPVLCAAEDRDGSFVAYALVWPLMPDQTGLVR